MGSLKLYQSHSYRPSKSLRGHRDQITAIRFIASSQTQPSTSTGSTSSLLLTSAKDTFIKLWDLSTQHCIQTIVAHRSEIWTLDVDHEKGLIFTGSSEGEMKAWRIDYHSLNEGLKETESGEVGLSFHCRLKSLGGFLIFLQVSKVVLPIATLPLSSRNRVFQITFHPTQPYLAVQSHDRSVEIFRIRTEEEVRKKLARKKKRAREKKGKVADPDSDDAETEVQLVDLFTPYLVVRATGKIRSFDFATDDTGHKGGNQASRHFFL